MQKQNSLELETKYRGLMVLDILRCKDDLQESTSSHIYVTMDLRISVEIGMRKKNN